MNLSTNQPDRIFAPMMHMAKRGKKQLLLAALVLVVLGTGVLIARSGASLPARKTAEQPVYTRQTDPRNHHMIDSGVALLRTGDLAMRTGADATSHMLRQMNQLNKTFSHCGVVVVENGYPFVYHSIGGEDNPEAMIRRDSAHFFFSPVNNIAMGIVRLDLDSMQNQALVGEVRHYFDEKRTFDMDFDLTSDRQLYCAEFVYKAVRAAAQDPSFFGLSHIGTFSYVGVDNLYENSHAKTICRIQYK